MEANLIVEAIELTVTTNETEIEVTEGYRTLNSPLKIPCMVSPKDSMIKWFFNNQATLPLNVIVSAQGTIRLNNVTRDHDGEYTCVGIRPNGKKKSVTITVKVNYPPEIVKFEKNQDDVTDDIMAQDRPINLVNFQQLSLVCKAIGKPSPKVFWTRNGEIISSESIFSIIPTEGEKSSGLYECVATNKIGNSSLKGVQVNVITKPELQESTTFSQYVMSESSKSYNVTCPVNNFEKSMTIAWTFAGQPIDVTNNEYEIIDNILTIRNISLKHQGEYRCLVSNEAGNVEVIVNVTINIEAHNIKVLEKTPHDFVKPFSFWILWVVLGFVCFCLFLWIFETLVVKYL